MYLIVYNVKFQFPNLYFIHHEVDGSCFNFINNYEYVIYQYM